MDYFDSIIVNGLTEFERQRINDVLDREISMHLYDEQHADDEGELMDQLEPGTAVILDNLATHRNKEAEELLR